MKQIQTGRNIAAVFFLAVMAAQFQICRAQDDPLMVTTNSGQLRGTARPGGGVQFLGIPFAQPPVGDLRWRQPLPAKPWPGILDAKAYASPCAQPDLGWWNHHDAQTGQEDCLYLNVVAPEWPKKNLLPVMVWLHGGANAGGTAMSFLYTGGTLPNHGVVLVSVNYRLGVFGFLAHPELTRESAHHASGNYGLMDQILALQWVISNIAQFGGDPKNITVFGQSAGSVDTGILMTSTVARGLFQKAIQQSGAPIFYPPIVSLRAAEDAGQKFAATMAAPDGPGQIAYLRASPAADLIKKVNVHDPHQFGPDVDGWVLTRDPAEVFAAGEESAIPLLFGTTTREEAGILTPDQVRGIIRMTDGLHAPDVLKMYGLDNGQPGTPDPVYGSPADQWAADTMFRCTSTTEARLHTAANHPAFQYEFNHPVPGQPLSIHGSDLTFVMGMYSKQGSLSAKNTDAEVKLADMIESYFTNFARTGDPNGTGLPAWPQFGDAENYVQFTSEGSVVVAKQLRGAQCTLYREIVAPRLQQAK